MLNINDSTDRNIYNLLGQKSRAYLLIAIVIGLIGFSPGSNSLGSSAREVSAATDPVIAAAGDIACDPSSSSFNGGNGTSNSCRQKYTSDLLVNADLAAVLALGDIQYYCGGYEAFLQSYDRSWGRVKNITRPAVGNHEYLTPAELAVPMRTRGQRGTSITLVQRRANREKVTIVSILDPGI